MKRSMPIYDLTMFPETSPIVVRSSSPEEVATSMGLTLCRRIGFDDPQAVRLFFSKDFKEVNAQHAVRGLKQCITSSPSDFTVLAKYLRMRFMLRLADINVLLHPFIFDLSISNKIKFRAVCPCNFEALIEKGVSLMLSPNVRQYKSNLVRQYIIDHLPNEQVTPTNMDIGGSDEACETPDNTARRLFDDSFYTQRSEV